MGWLLVNQLDFAEGSDCCVKVIPSRYSKVLLLVSLHVLPFKVPLSMDQMHDTWQISNLKDQQIKEFFGHPGTNRLFPLMARLPIDQWRFVALQISRDSLSHWLNVFVD